MAEQTNNPVDQWRGKIIWSILVFGAAIWVFIEISNVATGVKASVRVWWPIAVLYNKIGFWPSVLVLPCIGILLLIAGIAQFVKERN